MQKLTYINLLGDAVVFGSEPPYILERVRGLGKPDYKLAASRGAYQHGETPYGLLLEPRYVDLRFHIRGRDRAELYELREGLMAALASPRAFDGSRQGRLVYQNDHGTWWTYAIPEGPDPDQRVEDWLLSARMGFRCPAPHWIAEASCALTMAMSDGAFELPFRFPVRLGTRGFSGEAVNAGQVASPPRIEIAGSGETPALINHTTGARLAVSRAIATGDLLVIDTDPEALSVVIRTADGREIAAHSYLSLDSTLIDFALRPGVNALEYKPSVPSAASRVGIYWGTRMEGV